MTVTPLTKRIPYKNIAGKPYILVSSKGIINGLSDIINDGADFGPDTSNTQTTGIQEAYDYAVSSGYINPVTGSLWIPEIHLIGTDFKVYTPITFSGPSGVFIENLTVKGMSSMAPYIAGYINNEYMITLDFNNFKDTDIRFENMQPYVPSGYTPSGFITVKSPTVSGAGVGNIFEGYNIVIANPGWGEHPLNFTGMEGILLDNYEAYVSGSAGNFAAGGWITFIGGMIPSGTTLYLSGVGVTGSFGAPTVNLIGVSSVLGAQGVIFNCDTILTLTVIGSMYVGQITLSDTVATTAGFSFAFQAITLLDVYITLQTATSFLYASSAQYIQRLAIKTYIFRLLNSPTTTVQFAENITASLVDLQIDQNQLNGNTLSNILSSSVSVSTPSVPASGTAVQNTNLYPVKVYINGGALTGIQITIGGTAYTVYSNSTASAVYEGFTLPAGASITLTYTTSPTWSWVPE